MVLKWKGVTFDISFWKGETVIGAVLGTWIRKLCLVGYRNQTDQMM